MAEIFLTIAPIFLVVILGALVKKVGLVNEAFAAPANKLVYYVAIPAMVFSYISRASFKELFHFPTLVGTLAPAVAVGLIGAAVLKFGRVPKSSTATWLQAGFHGNIGYVGLAASFYFLGESGLTRAGILAGFLMLLQNFLAVWLLSLVQDPGSSKGKAVFLLKKISFHPVIISAAAGIAFSVVGLALPEVISKSLDIITGMALPLALLLIGGSLSLGRIRDAWKPALAASIVKLVVIPAVGLSVFRLLGLSAQDFLPGLVLLGAPTATLVYVMALEMNGDPDLAAAAISVSTLGSALTYAAWLSLF
ncbi:MAG: AEC family transporter [Pseudomonadota bacterium]